MTFYAAVEATLAIAALEVIPESAAVKVNI